MVYLVSHETSTYGLLEYDSENAIGYDDFWQGFLLGSLTTPLQYRLKKRSDLTRLRSRHLIESTHAPMLVSTNFRRVIETFAPNDAEFLPAVIKAADQEISDFWALNLIRRISCVDIDKSEYRQTNFDPNDPHYMFSYTVMQLEWDSTASIAICAEQPNQFAVSETIKLGCFEASLKGLIFFSALDMTYAERTASQKID